MDKQVIQIEDGKYSIKLEALKQEEDKPSVMSDYLSQVAIVSKEDTTIRLSLLLQHEQTITGFQVERGDKFVHAVERHVNEEKEHRSEAFELDFLPVTLNVRVQYEIEHDGRWFEGDEPLRLVFDKESLDKAE